MTRRREKVLLIQAQGLQPPGGGNAVAAVMADTLARHYDVSVLTWYDVPWEATNRFYGTELGPEALTAMRPPLAHRVAVDMLPSTGALYKILFTMRHARLIAAKYDLVISSGNEVDIGRRTIQYIHFPWGFWPRPNADLRWYHHIPGLLNAYYAFADAVAPVSRERIAANRTLANSAWTGERFRETYGGEVTVLHPPIAGEFRPRPWAERADTFVCVGRIAPEKRITESIAIVERVRQMTRRDLPLRIFGSFDNANYGAAVREAAASRPWVSIETDVSRETLLSAVGASRYGIHSMLEEHFGMAVAEMVRSGCVTFAHASGGPQEIVGDPALLFESADDAVAKISRVVEDEELAARLHRAMESRGAQFTREAFESNFLAIVREEIEASQRQ